MNARHYTPKASSAATSRQLKGEQEEQIACEFLQSKGLELLEQNFLCRMGEIDLIMQDKTGLIFVEVRYRKNAQYGGAAASVTRSKQRKIIRTALFYQQKYYPKSCMRFDVIAIEGDNAPQWFPSAFDGF